MTSHQTAIRAAFAGLLLATTLAGASAHAKVPDPECVKSCHQVRRACVLECAADNMCGMEYRVGRAECVVDTLPGAARQDCFQGCSAHRTACRANIVSCKTTCGQDFISCRNDCGVGQ